MLLIPNALCWSSWKCNWACALPAEVQLRLRVSRRSWHKLFAGKNFIKILVTVQTQLHSYSEQQRAFGNSNICNCHIVHLSLAKNRNDFHLLVFKRWLRMSTYTHNYFVIFLWSGWLTAHKAIITKSCKIGLASKFTLEVITLKLSHQINPRFLQVVVKNYGISIILL